MIYNLKLYTLNELLQSKPLLYALKKATGCNDKQARQKIKEAYNRAMEFKSDGNIAPCKGCGNIKFHRTGTCHVCVICGDSQGCS